MTEKELNQIYYLRREITMWQDKLKELSVIKPQSFVGTGGRCGVSNPVAVIVEQREKIRCIIDSKEAEVIRQEAVITKYITGIDDSMMRQIMYLRHIELMPWSAIAVKVGGGNTADGLRMIHKRFLQKK